MGLLFFYIATLVISTSYGNDYGNGQCTKWDRNQTKTVPQEILDELIDMIREYIPIATTNNSIFDMKSAMADYNLGLLDKDIHLNITQLIEKFGYPVEKHEVTTSDGYILSIFRIPGNGSVVFVMHGLSESADDLVTAGKERSLVCQLADAGYDVWMGNNRGNIHSRRNINLSPDCIEFWDYSFDEIGRKDLPAMIDYVLEKTNRNTLQYIGLSQGTSSFFVMCSEKPEYNDKISTMIALAPVAWLSHCTSPVFRLASLFSQSTSLFQHLFGYELAQRNAITNAIIDIACGTPEMAVLICYNLLGLAGGYDFAQVNATYLPRVFAHTPVSFSSKQLLHYGQEVSSGKFRQYDLGKLGNLKKYGSLEPPDYPVQKISARVVIFQADGDIIATNEDVAILMKNLPNFNHTSDFYRVPFKSFIHYDYTYANDVKTLVNDKILTYLNNN